MKPIFSIGPWLMDLIDPPARASLSLWQKGWRVFLVTVTIVTLCVIAALGVSLVLFAFQRGSDFFKGAPQAWDSIIILAASVMVNIACIVTLLQIKRLDRRLIPRSPAED